MLESIIYKEVERLKRTKDGNSLIQSTKYYVFLEKREEYIFCQIQNRINKKTGIRQYIL